MPQAIAIIGAGLAGLAAARRLAAAGHAVSLFDKGRGPGGRLSTRRSGDWRFDHGGQFVTARDPVFQAVMTGLLRAGHAARWDGRIVRLEGDGSISPHPVERFVGTPGMNGLIHGLAADLPAACAPRWGVRVAAISGGPGDWHLQGEDGGDLGHFGRLVLAIPAPQVVALLRNPAPSLAEQAGAAILAPCWALMLGFAGPVPDVGWDAAFIAAAGGEDRPLSWIAHDGAKPGRGGAASWVAHASPDWSQRHLEETADQVTGPLRAAFAAATGIDAAPAFIAAHRWRYALPSRPLRDGFLFDETLGIGVAGDWCLDARAEAAFLSGHHLAGVLGAA